MPYSAGFADGKSLFEQSVSYAVSSFVKLLICELNAVRDNGGVIGLRFNIRLKKPVYALHFNGIVGAVKLFCLFRLLFGHKRNFAELFFC